MQKRRVSRSPNGAGPSSDDNSPAEESNEGVAQLLISLNGEREAFHVRTEPLIGRKRAKEALENKKRVAKNLKLAQASVAVQQERNKTLKRHFEISLFTSAPAVCAKREAVEYSRIMRARALAEIRKEEFFFEVKQRGRQFVFK